MTTTLKYSASEIIEDAFLDSGIIPPDQVPEAEDVATGFRILNRLLKLWQVNMHLWLQEEGVIFLNPGQQSYLLGPDGDEATALDAFISSKIANPPSEGNALADPDSVEGDTDIFVDSTVGMESSPDLLTVDPIDADLWEPVNEAIVSVNGDQLIVTNGGNLSGSATFIMDLVVGVTQYRARVSNTSGEGVFVTFSIRDPNQIDSGRLILSTGDNSQGQLGIGTFSGGEDNFTQETTFSDSWDLIAAGEQSAFVITKEGELWAVGANESGQLGINSELSQTTYIQEFSEATDWIAVSGGLNFAVALKTDGTLWSSGLNNEGQLGTANFANSLVFVQESTKATDWGSIACGRDYAIAIKNKGTESGTLWGVGNNGIGQLGIGSTTDQVIFVEELGLARNWISVSGGKDFTLAVDSNNDLWATGDNTSGQLGIGATPLQQSTFLKVDESGDWLSVACGDDFSYATKTDKKVFSTGNNDKGQLSVDTMDSGRNIFGIALEKNNDYEMVASGDGFSWLIRTDGTLWSTGRNTYGQLAQNDTTDRDAYTQIGSATNWIWVACGNNHGIAIDSNFDMYAAGRNQKGQLGDNTQTDRDELLEVSPGLPWKNASCGNDYSLATRTNNTGYATGLNDVGQLGIGTTSDVKVFTIEVGTLTDWKELKAGGNHSVAMTEDGALWATGNNASRQLGNGETTNQNEFVQAYVPVNNVIKELSISLEGNFSAIIREDGTLWSAGLNNRGQLGLGNTTDTVIFKQESGGDTDWLKVSCGTLHMMAIKTDGTLYGTGANTNGELGIGNTTDVEDFTQAGSGSSWDEVVAGNNGTLALETTGELLVAGSNSSGVLSRYRDTTPQSSFIESYILTENIIDSNCGDEFMMFIKSDGTLWGTGKNDKGQLGNGSTSAPHSLAVQEAGKTTKWTKVACGADFCVALDSDGFLWGTGNRSQGQLGMAIGADITTFTKIGTSTWTAVACGAAHTMAISTTNQRIWGTGSNNVGQLGVNSATANFFAFTESHGSITWLSVACGQSHTIAIGTDHDLYGTGSNINGQLGLDTNSVFEIVFIKEKSGATNWSHISAGNSYSVATKDSSSRLFGAGLNDRGQLGTGDRVDTNVYTQGAFFGFTNVSCGSDFTLAQDEENAIWGVGNNQFGQLGIGKFSGDVLDWTTSTLTQPVSSFSTGFDSSAVIDTSGVLHTVGSNDKGQLDMGDTLDEKSFLPAAMPVVDVSAVSVGQNFSITIREGKTIWGSGLNTSGQLGTGNSTNAIIYTQESTGNTSWEIISCGGSHTIAIDVNAVMQGTGNNSTGQLGINSTDSKEIFTERSSQTGSITAIDCGKDHTVTINSDGEIFSTGSNSNGQLGLSSLTEQVLVLTQESLALKTWRLISAGSDDSMSATVKGCLVTGDNGSGELGLGVEASFFGYRTTFLLDNNVSMISAGSDFTMFVTEDGEIFGVGDDTSGQLGLAGATSIICEQEITKKKDWTTVSCGLDFTVALDTNKFLYATGDGASGQLGYESTLSTSFQQEALKRNDWESISAGTNYCLAIEETNQMSGTGDNTDGQMGANYISQTFTYIHIHTQMVADNIACGGAHAIVIKADSTLWSTGNNEFGQLGLNTTTSVPILTQTSLANVDLVACGSNHTMAIDSGKKLYGSGLNDKGQLGLNNTTNVQSFTQEFTGGTNWSAISCGAKHSSSIDAQKIFSSGLNGNGQLGINTKVDAITFTQESSGAANFTNVSCGGNHTMVIKSTSKIWGTGENSEGELGLNDTTDRLTFTESPVGLTWDVIASGGDHTMAINLATDGLWGTGDNSHGQLGIGTTSIEDIYRQEANGFTDWTSASCGLDHAMAIRTDGSLWGTGNNEFGQLALGNTDNKNIFTQEESGSSWLMSASGDSHTMAIKEGNTLWGSGLNEDGQLGVGNTLNQTTFAREGLVAEDWTNVSATGDFSIAILDDGIDSTLYGTGNNNLGQLGLGEAGSPVIFFTQEVSEGKNWAEIAAGAKFTVAIQSTDFFKIIATDTVSVDGIVYLNFDTSDIESVLGATPSGETAIFEISVDSDVLGSAVSIDNLQLRDAADPGDFIGILLDDGSRFWSAIDDILSETEIILTDPLPSDASTGNSVFVFDELIDRPLRIYNGRTLTFGDDNEIPVDDWSRQEYMQQPLKSSQGIPVNMYYTPELDDGRVYVWQTANNSNQMLNFTYDKPFEVTPDTASQPDIPVEWANPLKWAIAKELIPGYGVPIDRAAEIRANAAETLKEAQDNSNSSVYDLNVIPDMR